MTVPTNKSRWIGREQQVAEFIPPNSNVLDLGGWRAYLKETHGKLNKYICVDRHPEAKADIVADFNKNEFPEIELEDCVIVCVGLLEYLKDVPSFLRNIRKYGNKLIVTYLQRIDFAKPMGDLWLNNYSYVELLDV